jgi:Tol biopolymer transport system component
MSPDASRIVYDLFKDEESKIYVINKDGSNPVYLGKGSNPAWSPFIKTASK